VLNHVSGSRSGIVGIYQRMIGPPKSAPRSMPGATISQP
jgi:hypothetical protein